MMAGLTSMTGDMSDAAGLYKTAEEDEGEELVAAGPGLDALLGLERSVSNAMVIKCLGVSGEEVDAEDTWADGARRGTGCGLRAVTYFARQVHSARFKWR